MSQIAFLLLLSLIPYFSYAELLPDKMISYKSQPGQIYSGETTTASDLDSGLSGSPADQVCANQCSLSSLCGAYYVEGAKCHEVSVADKSNTKTDPTWPMQGPTYFIKSSTVDAPLYTTTTAAPSDIANSTTTTTTTATTTATTTTTKIRT